MATTTSVLGLTKPAGNENALVSVLNNDMDLIDAEAGKARGNIAATYSASSSYAVGDLCIYNGVLYKCNTAIGSGGEAWNASHWTQVTIDGQLSALTDQIGNLPSLVTTDKSNVVSAMNEVARAQGYIDLSGNSSVKLPMYSGVIFIMRNTPGIYGIFWGSTVQTYSAATNISVSVSGSVVTITNNNSTTVAVFAVAGPQLIPVT